MSWKDNAIMYWADEDGNLQKISDHGRSALSESYERFENSNRMHDGTLRKYVVGKKRTWSASWATLPSRNDSVGMKTVDGGWSGRQMEEYYRNQDDSFVMVLRNGSAINKFMPDISTISIPYEDEDFYVVRVMFSEFSKDTIKRGPSDWLDISVTLEEV